MNSIYGGYIMKLRKSFSIPYGGGELWASNLDGLKNDNSIILNRILEDEKLICRPSTPSLILYHLYGSRKREICV